jgi:2-polyprenyl-3-methyl-5-hydroxy-6-metoxy-1,4-benzoquinol methylase
MNTGNRDFDKEAASWDTPPRVQLAEDVARAIVEHVPLSAEMDVLDFGCGTGLVSLALRPRVRSVTGVDSSQGMLDIFDRKLAQANIPGVKTFHLDLEQGDDLPGSYHLIVTNMALHHIKHIQSVLGKLSKAILPGGCLVVTDLDPEGGLFHDNHDGVFHHGFEREALRRMFAQAGLEQIQDFSAAKMEKSAADGSTLAFSIFLMKGQKRSACK